MTKRVRIVHVINSFEYGGAEAMLCNLLVRTDRERYEPSVVALIDELTVAEPVRRAGIPLVTMGMRPGVPDPRGLARLASYLGRMRPAIVQTWMDHSNLIGGVAARAATRARVVWGVHHSDHVRGVAKRTTLMTVSACAWLSRGVPSRVVCCSHHARDLYAAHGFDAGKMTVIPNGFDTDAFRPDPSAGSAVRRESCIDPGVPVIGLVARYDPLKDHETFLRAAALLAARRADVRFLLCGDRVDRGNRALANRVDELGLAARCHLMGPRRDVARIYTALDVATSSSISEAFPLVLGEAMACGVPCVATDVGDSALIVGPTGRIVPARNPDALAAAWAELLDLDPAARARLGATGRNRVRELFDLGSVTRRYEALYDELLGPRHRGRDRQPSATPGPACSVSAS